MCATTLFLQDRLALTVVPLLLVALALLRYGLLLWCLALFVPGTHSCQLSLTLDLCGEPQLLLLDNPTNGVDPVLRIAVWKLLRQKSQGRAVLLTTHLVDKAKFLADRVVVLRQG